VTESQVRDQAAVPVEIRLLQIFQQPPTATHHLEQAATTVVVVLVRVEMVPEMVDALRQEGDLDGSTPDIAFVKRVLLDDFSLVHARKSLLKSRSLQGKQGLPRTRFASLKG
jgi:hypothetical protein